MDFLTKETLQDLLGVMKTAGEFVTEQTVDVVNQALNYALFEAVIALLGTLSLYLIYYIISKIMKAAEEANKIENTEKSLKTANALKTCRSILLVLFTGVVLYNSQGSVKAIGKIMISPKVYLMEEGFKILERLQTKKVEVKTSSIDFSKDVHLDELRKMGLVK